MWLSHTHRLSIHPPIPLLLPIHICLQQHMEKLTLSKHIFTHANNTNSTHRVNWSKIAQLNATPAYNVYIPFQTHMATPLNALWDTKTQAYIHTPINTAVMYLTPWFLLCVFVLFLI